MKQSNEWYNEGWQSEGKSATCPYTKGTLQYRSWWAGRFAAQEDPVRQAESDTRSYFDQQHLR